MTNPDAANLPIPTQGSDSRIARLRSVNDVTKEVDALYEATCRRPRGSLITHVEIEQIVGHQREIVDAQGRLNRNATYQKIVRKWKRLMLKGGPGISPVSSYNVGYKFPSAEEQLNDVPDAAEKSVARKVVFTKDVMEAIHDEDLNDLQRRVRRERLRQTREKTVLNGTHVTERRGFFSNPDTLPKWGGAAE